MNKLEDRNRWGYFSDWIGATHKIEILDETITGKYVVCFITDTLRLNGTVLVSRGDEFRVPKEDIKLEDKDG